MKAILALLLLMLVPRSYGQSIKDEVDQYDASVVSANTHYTDGRSDFYKSHFQDANVEYSEGKQSVETAKRQEKDIRAYLKAHPEEPQLSAIQTHVDERSNQLVQIDANLDDLEKRIISKRSKPHLIVPSDEKVGRSGSETASQRPNEHPTKGSKEMSTPAPAASPHRSGHVEQK